jgi:hypothetical protein
MIDERSEDDHSDPPDIIETSMEERSRSVGKASEDATANDLETVTRNVMPLLGLEPANAENAEQNPTPNEDSNPSAMSGPLLGTSTSEIVANARKSSSRRSPKRVCYAELLHDDEPSSPAKPQKTVHNASRDLHLVRRARWRVSIWSKLSLPIASCRASTR